jgi:hypothetical protein
VAFRLHVPSEITYHNALGGTQRGNILAWEQPLANRLRGDVVELDVQMAAQSILATTLSLFVAAGAAAAVLFALVIWWVKRRGTLRGNLKSEV